MELTLDRPYKSKVVKEYNILYVDDEVVNLRIFNQSFKRYYHVFTAEDAYVAIEILQKEKIDLIITDQQMPGMTGSELLIKIVPRYPNIIRMIMTGFSDINAISSVVNEVGLDKYLVKPWNKDELKAEFDKSLKLRSEDAAAQNINEAVETLSSNQTNGTQNQEEKKEIPLSNEVKKSELFDYDKIINCNINLKESLLPNEQELKLYLEDAFILHEHYKLNKNTYWFAENKGKLLIAFFNCNTENVQALALNTFINTSLIELFYQEGIDKSNEIVSHISRRIQNRFFSLLSMTAGLSTDASVLIYDQSKQTISYSGANQNFFYFDKEGNFKSLEGAVMPLAPGVNSSFDAIKMQPDEISSAYFVSSIQIREKKTIDKGLGIEEILKEIYKYPMNLQMEALKKYNYKNMIGMKF